MELKLLDLFSGIGGFSYAAERIVGGYKTTQFVEIDPYCRSVIRKNFPNTPIHDDIKTFTGKPGQFDVFTAGFPCQDLSVAGKQRGIGEGTRSGLFYEIIRLLGEIQPRFVLFENVRNLLSHEKGETFQEVLFQIAKAGYDAEWSIISAKDLGACHRRERIWIIAYPKSERLQRWQRNNQGEGRKILSSEQHHRDKIRSEIRRIDGVQSEERDASNPQSQSSNVAEPKSAFNKESHKSEFGNSNSKFTNSGFTSNSNSDGSSTTEGIRINEETSRSSQEREKKISKSERGSKSRGSETVQQTSETPNSANSISDGTQSNCEGLETPIWTHAFLNSKERRTLSPNWQGYVSEPSLCRGDDGLSNRVARIKALGNSIVPNCAAVPLQRIKDLNEELW
jgi:DNA (cytosine-5)-methyltransferase 1